MNMPLTDILSKMDRNGRFGSYGRMTWVKCDILVFVILAGLHGTHELKVSLSTEVG